MFPKEETLRRRSALRRRAPRMQTAATVRRIPAVRPGKKPARTAVAGNLSHSLVMKIGVPVDGELEAVVDEREVAVVVRREEVVVIAEEVAVDALEEDGPGPGTAFWSELIAQFPALLQL